MIRSLVLYWMVIKGLYIINFSTTNNTNNIKLSTWSWMVTKGLLDLACTISKSILTSYLLWKVKSQL